MFLKIPKAIACNPALSLRELSNTLGVSRKQVQLFVKSQTGMEFRAVRKICRLCHSVSLLASGHSIKETALNCGYNHPGNYTRAVKKYLGVAPSELLKTTTVS